MTAITPQVVSRRLERNDDDLFLVDVRPEAAFERWHVPGSDNLDVYDQLQADPESAADELATLPEDEEIVTVCRAGSVADTATDLLRKMGYDAKTLADGLAGWARVHRTAALSVPDGTLVQVARPGTGCLSYVVVSDGEAVVVDPSQYTDRYETVLAEHDADLVGVLETHAHADHVSGARSLAAAHDVPYYLHPADSGSLTATTEIEDGDDLTVGETTIRVVHTPGHTEGSVTFDVAGAVLLTGDTLFLDSVGRPDLDGGDDEAIATRAGELYESVQRLLDSPDATLVLPGHDRDAPTPPETATVADLREHNDLLDTDRQSFVDAVTSDVPETPPNHDRIKGANVGEASLASDEARQLELGPNKCAAE